MRVCPLIVVTVLAACDDEVDLTGIYRVDLDVASSPCGADQPVTQGPAYLSFREQQLYGQPYFTYDECRDSGAADCPDRAELTESFFEPVDGGWLGRASTASGFGGACVLLYWQQRATLSGNQLVIERAYYREQAELAVEACTPQEADDRGVAMPCLEHRRTEATRL
jgi:hypothetical protein